MTKNNGTNLNDKTATRKVRKKEFKLPSLLFFFHGQQEEAWLVEEKLLVFFMQ